MCLKVLIFSSRGFRNLSSKKCFIFSFFEINTTGRKTLRNIVWRGKKIFKRISRLEKDQRKPKNRIVVMPIEDSNDNENLSSVFDADSIVKMGK